MLPVRSNLNRNNDWMTLNRVPSLFGELTKGLFNDDFENSEPKMNIRESKNSYTVELAAPGMTKDDLKVTLDNNNTLNIRMEKKEQRNEGKENSRYYRHEFSYNSFSQSFSLPEDCNVDGIKAKAENGIVEINIPKKCNENVCNCKQITVE